MVVKVGWLSGVTSVLHLCSGCKALVCRKQHSYKRSPFSAQMGQLKLSLVLKIGTEVCRGMDYLHKRKVQSISISLVLPAQFPSGVQDVPCTPAVGAHLQLAAGIRMHGACCSCGVCMGPRRSCTAT